MNFIKQPDGSYMEAGREAGVISGQVVDDTKDLYVLVSVPPVKECEDYYLESECIGAGCYWYDNACHKMPPSIVCSEYTTESECVAAGCQWVFSETLGYICRSKPKEDEIPWLPILIAVGGVAAAIGVFFVIKR